MKCLPLFCAGLALTFAVAGCKKQNGDNAATANNPNEVVASVDGVKYLREDLDTLIGVAMKGQNIPEEQLEEARAYFENRFINEFIQKTLLLNEAKKEGITVTDEDRAEMIARAESSLAAQNMTLDQYFQKSPLGEASARAEFEKGIIFDKLLKEKVTNNIVVEESEVEQVVASIKAQNAAAEENNAKMESKDAKRAKLEAIKKQLDDGADFAKLAEEHSACPSGKQASGALGTFQRGQMVKPFEDAAFTQEIGKVGGIVETQFGFHLILVTEKNPAAEATDTTPATPETVAASHILIKFDEEAPVRPIPPVEEIRAYLKEQRSRPLAQEYLTALKAKAKIESIIQLDD